MRCHRVTAVQVDSRHPLSVRYAASESDARHIRNGMMEEFGLPKKVIFVEPCEIATNKEDLLNFLNVAMAVFDLSKPQDK